MPEEEPDRRRNESGGQMFKWALIAGAILEAVALAILIYHKLHR